MLYIEGLGYIDNSSSAVSNANPSSKVMATSFDTLLEQETAKISDTKTYNLEDIFKEAAAKYNISQDLLEAIAYHESRFKADATSQAGAMGIMQLMPQTAESLGVTDAYDPYENIMGAAKLLGKLSDMYDGDKSLMLAAYNAGSGNVAKYGGIPPFAETQKYVANVLATLEQGVNVPDKTISVATNQEVDNEQVSKYTASKLNDIYSYSDYQILMTFYENMLEIISSIGDVDDSSSNSENDSLASLFRLGTGNISYNRNNINLF